MSINIEVDGERKCFLKKCMKTGIERWTIVNAVEIE
jgi:hypothetical protein